jgi:hypothetical protein
MMNKKEIKRFAKNIIRSQKGVQNRQLMHPRREWMIGIFIAVCIFAASITWSSIQYFEYQNSEQQTVVESNAPVAVYRETLVQEALAAFEQKSIRLNILLGGRASLLPDEEVLITEPDTEVSDSPEVTEEQNEGTATTTEVSASSSEPGVVSQEPALEEPEEGNVPAGEGSVQLAPSI